MSSKTKSMFLVIAAIVAVLIVGYLWFNHQSGSKNIEQVQSELRTVAAGAQDYYLKPRMIGGGGKSFSGFTFEQVRLQNAERSPDEMTLTSRAARYSIEEVQDELLIVRADFRNNNLSVRAEIGPESLLIQNDE